MGALKKEEKERLKTQKEQRDCEYNEMDEINDKIYTKTVNAYQRLLFTVLKQGRVNCIVGALKSIKKFHRIIRKEFYEGLYALTTNVLTDSSVEISLEAIDTILFLYKNKGIDYKTPINKLYEIIRPFNQTLKLEHCDLLVSCIRKLFIQAPQSPKRTTIFIQRLILLRITRYLPLFDDLIKELEIHANINLLDFEGYRAKDILSTSDDIDKQQDRFSFEYFLYKKQ